VRQHFVVTVVMTVDFSARVVASRDGLPQH